MFNSYKIETTQDLQHTNEVTPLKLGSLEAELRTSKQGQSHWLKVLMLTRPQSSWQEMPLPGRHSCPSAASRPSWDPQTHGCQKYKLIFIIICTKDDKRLHEASPHLWLSVAKCKLSSKFNDSTSYSCIKQVQRLFLPRFRRFCKWKTGD